MPMEQLSEKSVLIIEDNRDVADSLKLWLQLYGHKVYVAYIGQEGIRQVHVFKPDYIFVDIGLPDLNGYEVGTELRNLFKGTRVKIIALSGYLPGEKTSSIFDDQFEKPMTSYKLQKIGLLAKEWSISD